jgi:hypothetical protein
MIGYVYRIFHRTENISYVGSTYVNITKRWISHKSKFRCEVRDGASETNFTVSIYPYFYKHGIDAFDIALIKAYDVIDVKHLRAYEQLWINKIPCVNQFSTFKIQPVVRATKLRRYYANRDAILKYEKCRYYANRDVILIRCRERYYANRERVHVDCQCGGAYVQNNIKQHNITHRHQQFLHT